MKSGQRINRLPILLFIFLLSGCMQPVGGGIYAWIDVPVDGLTVAAGAPLRIEGHASGDSGVTQVHIYLNGEPLDSIDIPPGEGDLYHYEYGWVPQDPGDHTIHVVAANGNDLSVPDSIVVHVTGDLISPTPITPTVVQEISVTPVEPVVITISVSPTLVISDTPTSTATATPSLSPVPPTATFTPVPPTNTFTPHPPTRTFTPTSPPPDTTPPAAPKQIGPGGGGDIDCVPNANLSWNASSDPSGIAEYRVELERSADNATWGAVGTYPGIAATMLNVTTECGWYYRWRVMAVDGVGNASPFSGWQMFIVTLT